MPGRIQNRVKLFASVDERKLDWAKITLYTVAVMYSVINKPFKSGIKWINSGTCFGLLSVFLGCI